MISFVTDPNFIPKHRSPRNYCNKYNKILLPYLVRSGDDSRTTKHISVDNPLIIIPLLRASSIVVPGLYLICRLNIKCDDSITYFAHYISSVHHYTVYDSVAGSGRKSNQILKLKLRFDYSQRTLGTENYLDVFERTFKRNSKHIRDV